MNRPYETELRLALEAVAAAGAAVMRVFGTALEVTLKAPDQPLTAADLEADAILRDVLLARSPGYGWLSEETVDRPDRLGRERVWIVDPIDGTRSFIDGRPEFSLSVGLAEHGEAVLGVVSNPATGELFWAVRGGGAFLRREGRDEPVAVERASAEASLLASRSELAAGEFAGLSATWRIRPTGSTAYKLAKVAAGGGSAFLSRGPKSEWDVCAGALLVAEAGGVVTDLEGGVLRYNRPDPYVHGILAGTPAAHRALLEECRRLPPTTRLRPRPRNEEE